MAFTFNDVEGKIVLHSWGRFRAVVNATVDVGDLLCRMASEAADCYKLADESGGLRADAVACEPGIDGQTIWMALMAELKAPSTVGTGGVVTRQYFMGTPATDFLGSPLYLHEDGKVDESVEAEAIVQPVGVIVASDRIVLAPGMPSAFTAPAAHIANGSDAGSTQTAVNAVLVVLENLGFVKMA